MKLRAWFASLAGRNSSPVDILFGPGDSITEGSGATTKADRWQDLVRDALRSRYQPSGVAGGAGYIPAFTYYNNPVTYSGSYTQPSTNGLGFLGITMSPAATATLSFTGTALDVFVTKVSGGGTLTVSVDGASSGTGFASISTANASQVNGAVTRVGGLSAGAHTVVVTASSGTSTLEGLMVYNGDETKGIRIWNNAHSGHSAGSFTSTGPWTGALAAIQPALMVIMLGVNDWRTASTSITAVSNYIANVRSIISAARAACTVPPSVLLIAPYLPATGTNNGIISYQPFQNCLYELAESLSDTTLLNLFARTGGNSFQGTQLGLLQGDNVHPSDKGHQFIADAVAGKLVA